VLVESKCFFCSCCLLLIKVRALSMVVAFDSSSSFTKCVSLNSSIACSFSRLSSDVSAISNARFIIESSATRQTWYCSGKCCVTYSLMFSLACSCRYCTSVPIEDVDTCSRCAISAYVKPRPLNSMTLSLRHCNISALFLVFVLKFPVFPS
jgi:hypothetical protein